MRTLPRGMTLIDVLIGSALFLIIFLALTTTLRTSALLSNVTKAKTGATSLLSSQMEYLRSLPYDAIGTKTGTPSGVLDAFATTTTNGVAYSLHTDVVYVDDSHDGTASSDGNGIPNDYKVVQLTVTYDAHGTRTEELAGTFVPPHIESSVGGGTLQAQVVNPLGAAVSGATVRVTNTTVSPAVDTSVFSNAKGIALFGGLKPGTGYQVQVSESGYSSAQTASRTTTNANPASPHLTVVANKTTSSTFVIDTLASFTVTTIAADLSPIPSAVVTVQGLRTLGTSDAGVPVYATQTNGTTNGSGSATFSLPWDIYSISVSGHTIASSSKPLPYQALGGTNATITLTLSP